MVFKMIRKATAIFLSLIIAAGIFTVPAAAAEDEIWITADNTAADYCIWNSYNYMSGDAACGAYYSDDAQSIAEIKADGAFYKQGSPYTAFLIEAPSDGIYNLRPVYYVGGNNIAFSDYQIALSVNDERFFLGKKTSSSSGAQQKISDDDIAVRLDKGVNVVRIMPNGSGTRPENVYADICGLYMQNGLTAVKRETLVLEANKSSFVNKYNASRTDCIGDVGQYLGEASVLNLSFDNLTQDTLSACPYFSYTVDVPRDGYYDIDLSFNTGGTAFKGNGYFILRLDGAKYKKKFVNLSDGYNIANLGVYMTAGTHTLTVSSAFEHTAFSNSYATWCDIRSITVYGGAVKSSVQIDPQTLPDEENESYISLSCADYAVANLNGSTGAGGEYIFGGTAYNGLQSLESLGRYIDKSATPYVAYTVYAPYDGSYEIAPVYTYSGAEDYCMTVKVNDSAPLRYYYNSHSAGINAEFKQGRNTVYLIPAVSEYETALEKGYVYQYGLNISPKLSGIKTSVYTGNAADVSFCNLFTDGGATYIGGVSGSRDTSLCIDSLSYSDISKTAYFAYSVSAPENGYYDITLSFETGDTAGAENTLPLFVDGNLSAVTYRKNLNGGGLSDCRADISCYLTAGEHLMVIGAQMPKAAGGAYVSQKFGDISLFGGLSPSAAQIDPNDASYKRIEAENDSYYNKYSAVYKGISSCSAGTALANASWDWGKAQAASTLGSYFDKSNMLHVSFMVVAPENGVYSIKPVYTMGNAGGVTDPFTSYSMNVLVNNKLYTCGFTAGKKYNENGTSLNAELVAGVNVITLVPFTLESQNRRWVDVDCLDIDGRLSAKSYRDSLYLSSGKSSQINRFSGVSDSGLAGDACMYEKSLGLTVSALNRSNLSDVSYFSYTVEAPVSGYYDTVLQFAHGNIFGTDPYYFGFLVDGAVTPVGWRRATNNTGDKTKNLASTAIYLSSGVHTVTFTNQMPLSDASGSYNWTDFGYVTFYGGLKLYNEQYDPKNVIPATKGLNPYSGYTVSGNVISGVTVGTDLGEFMGSIIKSSSAEFIYKGGRLSSTDIVGGGTQIVYSDGTKYIVDGVKYDLNGDGKIDIRDLKAAKEYAFGNGGNEYEIRGGDLNTDGRTDFDDIGIFRGVIMSDNSDKYVTQHTFNAASIIEYCNPVGRLTESGNSMFMEASASNFTLSGYISGDIVADLSLTETENDGTSHGVYVEIDGNTSSPTRIDLKVGDNNGVVLASGLSYGYHTVKVSKQHDGRHDYMYWNALRFTGKPVRTSAKKHRIEFLGDSITAGFGVESGNTNTYSYYSYANFTADKFDADYYSVANGGWCFSPTLNAGHCIASIYEKQSQNLSMGDWDFSRWQPDVVVINLGTNDKFNTSATEEIYRTDVTALLNKARRNNPNAVIIWVYGMMWTDNEQWIKSAVEEFAKTDGNTHYYHMPIYNAGTYAHPDTAGNREAAEILAGVISEYTGWKVNG